MAETLSSHTIPDARISPIQNWPIEKKSLDFSRLVADGKLTGSEGEIVQRAYREEREELFRHTKMSLRNFITSDFWSQNMIILGGSEWLRQLQKALKLNQTGSFDPETFRAIIEYQKHNNLPPTGIVDPTMMRQLTLEKYKSPFLVRIHDTVRQALEISAPKYRDPEIGMTWDMIRSQIAMSAGTDPEWLYNAERFQRNRSKQLAKMIVDLDAAMNGKLTEGSSDRTEYLKAREGLMTMYQEYRVGGLTGAEKGAAFLRGFGNGVYETGKWVVSGVVSLGKWIVAIPELARFLFSGKVTSTLQKSWNTLSQVDILRSGEKLSTQAKELFLQECQRISKLPEDQQIEAAGTISAKILAGMGLAKVASGLAWASTRAQAMKEASEVLTRTWNAESVVISGAREGVKAVIYKIGEFTLNGPTESILGSWFSRLFRSISWVIRGNDSIRLKRTVLHDGIDRFENAIQTEKNPERKRVLTEAKKALQQELEKIETPPIQMVVSWTVGRVQHTLLSSAANDESPTNVIPMHRRTNAQMVDEGYQATEVRQVGNGAPISINTPQARYGSTAPSAPLWVGYASSEVPSSVPVSRWPYVPREWSMKPDIPHDIPIGMEFEYQGGIFRVTWFSQNGDVSVQFSRSGEGDIMRDIPVENFREFMKNNPPRTQKFPDFWEKYKALVYHPDTVHNTIRALDERIVRLENDIQRYPSRATVLQWEKSYIEGLIQKLRTQHKDHNLNEARRIEGLQKQRLQNEWDTASLGTIIDKELGGSNWHFDQKVKWFETELWKFPDISQRKTVDGSSLQGIQALQDRVLVEIQVLKKLKQDISEQLISQPEIRTAIEGRLSDIDAKIRILEWKHTEITTKIGTYEKRLWEQEQLRNMVSSHMQERSSPEFLESLRTELSQKRRELEVLENQLWKSEQSLRIDRNRIQDSLPIQLQEHRDSLGTYENLAGDHYAQVRANAGRIVSLKREISSLEAQISMFRE